MKKYICYLLLISIALSLAACGSQTAPSAHTANAPESSNSSEEMEELSALGDVEVINGLLTVSITIPADMGGQNLDQAELDANAGEHYVAATKNEDGSVTYKLTKAQHSAMMDEFKDQIDKTIQDMIADESSNFTEITYNKNMSVFEAKMSVDELGAADSFASVVLFMCGGLYQIFYGEQSDSILVNYYAPDGTLITTANSADLGS